MAKHTSAPPLAPRRPHLQPAYGAALGLAALACAILLAAAAPAHPAAAAATATDPWVWLARVRLSLAEAGASGAAFTQTYIPAGFSSGEKETGSLSLHLPDCLRWDYRDPYPKSFLLCGDMVHAWNAEDHTGRRYHVDRKNEPGLDLLLLGVDDLKARYDATATASPAPAGAAAPSSAHAGSTASGGAPPAVQVRLSPKAKTAQLTDAALTIDGASLRVVEVSYHDREGNLTRFQIGDYHALPAGQFSPPAGIQWEDQR